MEPFSIFSRHHQAPLELEVLKPSRCNQYPLPTSLSITEPPNIVNISMLVTMDFYLPDTLRIGRLPMCHCTLSHAFCSYMFYVPLLKFHGKELGYISKYISQLSRKSQICFPPNIYLRLFPGKNILPTVIFSYGFHLYVINNCFCQIYCSISVFRYNYHMPTSTQTRCNRRYLISDFMIKFPIINIRIIQTLCIAYVY